MRRLSDVEEKAINDFIDEAYNKARKNAQKKWGYKGAMKKVQWIEAEYHRIMDRHAASLGLRIL